MRWLPALLAGCALVPPTGSTDPDTASADTDAVREVDTDPVVHAILMLSEVLASNEHAWQDPEADGFPDLIELVAFGEGSLDVGGWTVSDAGASLTLPEGTVLAAGEVLLVLADDAVDRGPLHAGFRLAKEGDEVTLRDPRGAVVDHVAWSPDREPPLGEQVTDASIVRAGTSWALDATPTPGEPCP